MYLLQCSSQHSPVSSEYFDESSLELEEILCPGDSLGLPCNIAGRIELPEARWVTTCLLLFPFPPIICLACGLSASSGYNSVSDLVIGRPLSFRLSRPGLLKCHLSTLYMFSSAKTFSWNSTAGGIISRNSSNSSSPLI